MPKEIAVRQTRIDGAEKSVTIGWVKDGLAAQLGAISDDGSVWLDLERHDINNLITALRKARDQAYGRDE